MNIYSEISSNKRNSYILLFVFIIIILILGYVFGLIFGNSYFGIIFAFIFSIMMILIGYYSGDKLILSMSKAREADKKEHAFLINTVEGLSIAAGIPMPKVYVMEEDSINAFATGRDPKHASITLTTGALKKLKRIELEGVIAHEMSHIKNFDIRLMMLVSILVGVIILLSDFIIRNFLWAPRQRHSRGSGGIFYLIIIVAGLLLAILSPIIAQVIRFSISRKREFLADSSGALLTRYPKGLADALKKIRDDKDKLVDSANKATAHLYLENPLRKIGGKINSLFNTHPDINERIKKLESI